MIWLFSSLVVAGGITPWLYRAGRWLAGEAAKRDLPGLWEWLGAACGRSLDNVGRYFDRSLLLAALLLLPALLWWIRRKPDCGGAAERYSLRRLSWNRIVLWFGAGFAIAAVAFWLLSWVLVGGGAFIAKDPAPGLGKIVMKTIPPMIGAPLVEEWIFRGVLLGLWLRFTGPWGACVGSSLMFSLMHFLNPPKGTGVGDPAAPGAGFELLGQVLNHFADPVFFLTDFATLFALGLLLGWARIRTRSLWIPIGIHAGLVGAFKVFNLLFRKVPEHQWSPWGVGDTLRSGLLPLATLLLIAWATAWLIRLSQPVSRA